MQRAASYLSIFISDFDIEDPDHDLAGFGDAEHEPEGGQHRLEGEHAAGSASGSDDDLFAPDRRRPEHGHGHGHDRVVEEEEEEEAEKRWSVTSRSKFGGGSPCPTTGTQTELDDDESLKKLPSSRSMGMPTNSNPQSGWLTWLRRRWSPLKEGNLKMLMKQEGQAQGLLDRYLTEQAYTLEVAQAELIQRETQDDTQLTLGCPHAQCSGGGEAERAFSECGDLGDEYEDEVLSNHCGDTSVSDGDDPKALRQSRLSEASTARFNPLSCASPRKREQLQSVTVPEKTEGKVQRSSFFSMVTRPSLKISPSPPHIDGLNMDGLDELWSASTAYDDSWAKHSHNPVEKVSSGCQQQ